MLGSILIVIGLYSVLWGKHKESVENKAEEIPDAIKVGQVHGNGSVSAIEDVEAANEIQMGKGDQETNNKPIFCCLH